MRIDIKPGVDYTRIDLLLTYKFKTKGYFPLMHEISFYHLGKKFVRFHAVRVLTATKNNKIVKVNEYTEFFNKKFRTLLKNGKKNSAVRNHTR